MGHVQTGARLTCAGCGTQVMVVKAPSAAPSCCGVPLAGPATGKEGGDGERRR